MIQRAQVFRWAILLFLGCSMLACSSKPKAGRVFRFDDNLTTAVSIEGPQLKRYRKEKAFKFDQSVDGWTSVGGTSTIEHAANSLVFTAKGEDRLASPTGLDLDGGAVDSIELKMKVSGPSVVSLNWIPLGAGLEEHRVLKIQVPRQNEAVVYNLKMSELKSWRYRQLDQILFHVNAPAKLEIESIRFLNRRSLFSQKGAGVTDYAISNGVRPTLYSHCPGKIEYHLTVPQKAIFTAGLSVVDEGIPVTFEVLVEKAGTSRTVFSQQVSDPQKWQEVRADLSEFAGQEVNVWLVSNAADVTQVALWSNPAIFEPREEEAGTRAPNVVLYVIDCLRPDHLDAYGYGRKTAPNLAAFAQQAVRFDRCFAQDTWTKSSTSSFLTGVDQLYHGVEQYGDVLPAALATFPELLRRWGYETCALSENPHTPPETQGKMGFSRNEPIHLGLEVGPNLLSWQQIHAVTLETAINFMKENKDHPFFVYAHTMELHDIRPEGVGKPKFFYDPPEDYKGKFVSENGQIQMDLYDDAVSFADDNFKRFLDQLDQLGLADNTVVIVTADHGEAFGEHEGYETHHWKPYNSLTRVPLLIRWPGKASPGVVKENVQLIDLAPTILDLAGVAPSSQFQGNSIAPLLRGSSGKGFDDRLIITRWYGSVAGVKGDWKLMCGIQGEQPSLFNLNDDMGEQRDVAGQNPQVVERIKSELLAHIQKQQTLREGLKHMREEPAVAIDPRLDEQMKVLGYTKQ